jgi:imidazolonepropionase-like amidohydrolase
VQSSPETPIRWVDLHIQGDSISDIVEIPVAEGVGAESCLVRMAGNVVDGAGAFAIPGLINLHTHLFRKVRPGEDLRVYSPVSSTIRALRNGYDCLRQGVTTVRELGAPEDLDIVLSSLVATGQVTGPRIVAAGRPLTQTGGHNHAFGVVVDGPMALRQAVRARKLAGVGWIKLMASQGGTRHFAQHKSPLPPEDPDESWEFVEQILARAEADKVYPSTERDGYTLEELQAATDEAGRLGLGTAAHAVTAQSVINAVRAGIGTVEHATFLSAEAARQLTGSDTVYVPTVSTAINRIVHGRREGWPDYLLRWAMFVAEPWFAALLVAREYGVAVATGTDGGGEMFMEMDLLHRAGFTAHEVLRAATEVPAQVLGRPDLGLLSVEAKADVVLLASNPLDDLLALKNPLLTVAAGRILDDRGRDV